MMLLILYASGTCALPNEQLHRLEVFQVKPQEHLQSELESEMKAYCDGAMLQESRTLQLSATED